MSAESPKSASVLLQSQTNRGIGSLYGAATCLSIRAVMGYESFMTLIATPFDAGMQERRQAIHRWGLIEDGLPFQTSTSVLQRVRIKDGAFAFLKVTLCEEERRGAALLRWWGGEGAVRVLALHRNAVLLECACGGRSLAKMVQAGEDDEASRIICHVAARLHSQAATDLPELMPLSQCFHSLALAVATRGGVFQELSAIAGSLLATPRQVVVLHGDLHHENVLDAGVRGWLCIDPKGYFGERGFDHANIFCNPDYHTATQPERFERRVNIVAEAAQLEHHRLLSWIAAWAGLSAAWHLEDGGNADTALAVAALALCALRR